jgi:hypothetical protein
VGSLGGGPASCGGHAVAITPSDIPWSYCTGAFAGLSFRFGVRTDDSDLGRYVEHLLESLRADTSVAHWYSLRSSGDGGVDLYLDDALCAQLPEPSQAVDRLLWDINRASADASDEHLLFHAGGVQFTDQAILLPAASGRGKSTLVAGLVHAGLGYLSDELLALSLDDTRVLAYPKPVALKAGSFGPVRDLGLEPPAGTDRFSGDEWYVRPADLGAQSAGGPCVPALVIVPRYVPGAVTSSRRLSSTETFLALALNSVNLDHHGEQGAHVVADLVERCDAFELEMSDLTAACKLVLGLVEERGRSDAR